MHQKNYIGRFAPSPTGNLHLGSLMTAIASYCDAMHHGGQWIVRIEDLDPPREVSGASQNIIKRLNDYGFIFNQDIIYQSQAHRQKTYQKTLETLINSHATYYCPCSRAELKKTTIDDHQCRTTKQVPNQAHSIKIAVPDLTIKFIDRIQKIYTKNLYRECGDFIIKRRDKLFAYQIAVVVDDHYQNISHIVRGIDLIDSTPWQIFLNSLLGFKQPSYAHIPILVNAEGQKLSKQTYAKEISDTNIIETLSVAYGYLNQTPFTNKPKSISDFWNHAISNWNINKVSNIESIAV
ncbi:MAG: tRNA glutamyl-Q(34) synthetase GluQRS [Marinicellaceae bacterium]